MITGNEPIHHITGADGVPFSKSDIDTSIVYNNIFSGLTIRQHFAAMAMQGIIRFGFDNSMGKGMFEAIAADSVTAADALITELNKTV